MWQAASPRDRPVPAATTNAPVPNTWPKKPAAAAPEIAPPAPWVHASASTLPLRPRLQFEQSDLTKGFPLMKSLLLLLAVFVVTTSAADVRGTSKAAIDT